jgi:uncharacterized protein (DUF1330 family)
LSRSLFGFLLFCLVLVLASAAVVWYLGPTLTGIAFDGERRDSPYYLLQLLPREALRPGPDQPSYRSRFLALAEADQGRPAWQGSVAEVLEGPVLLDVAAVQLVAFATGGELVQMLTSSGYRSLRSAASELELPLLGSAVAPQRLQTEAASVLVLYRSEKDTAGEPGGEPAAGPPLGVPGGRGWLVLVPRFGGEVRWQAPVAPIRMGGGGAPPWNRVLLLQFPDAAAAEAWLDDPRTATERAIARKHVDDMVVLLLQASRFGGR